MKRYLFKITACFLIVWFPLFISAPVFAQDMMMQTGNENMESTIQNAVLEGIQLTKEAGNTSDENILTCYFIFRDKPSSYFYEAKRKEKKIIFEFNDAVLGSSPIPTVKEPPIRSFDINEQKIDANKEVVGLNPEWHDIMRVTFYMDAIPKISVKDEYSVISFSFTWSTDTEKIEGLTDKEKTKKPLIFALIGSGIAGLGIFGLIKALAPDNGGSTTSGDEELKIDDLPDHDKIEESQ